MTIRKLTTRDREAAMAVAESTGLFDESQMRLLHKLFDMASTDGEDQPFWVGNDDDGLRGVVYCEPERMTHGTWNVQLIAVHPDHQKQQVGTSMLLKLESMIRAMNGRILLVDTAGIDEFEHVRNFYTKNGFSKEASVRDFYAPEVDRITFRKVL